MRLVLKNFHIVDETSNFVGSVVIDNGIIGAVISDEEDFPQNVLNTKEVERAEVDADMVIQGRRKLTLMPAFIDLHAHFRDPGFPDKETLESASLAAAAGGYGTVVCMANTKPVTDTLEKAAALKKRSDVLNLIDLYPVLSLTKNMDGKELSGISELPAGDGQARLPLMLSEDGKDINDEAIFLAALKEARRLGVPVSCHCDFGGGEAETAKQQRKPRSVWSRIEENNGVRRAIELGKQAGCHIHIAHVSTKESAEMIRNTKSTLPPSTLHSPSFTLTCEATPHHISCTEGDAHKLGDESYGRVNPPLRTEEDRQAIIAAIQDGTIDAIATDHAPHTKADKAAGAPGFTGLETGFASCYTNLIAKNDQPETGRSGDSRQKKFDLRRLSALMSANPARILGLDDRGRIAPGLRADLVIADLNAVRTVKGNNFYSRGHCTPFEGWELWGKILMTIQRGRIVFSAGEQ
ncbi:MAG: dihydroorotase [Treponema sp.]|jgi:dihydroorotase|nr:dihydroorotase [Treponema sp.]